MALNLQQAISSGGLTFDEPTFQGPVRKGSNESQFRTTGNSGGGGSVLGASTGGNTAGGGGFDVNSLIGQVSQKSNGKQDRQDRDEQEEFINQSFGPAISALDSFMAQLSAQQPGLIATQQQRGELLKGQALGEQSSQQEALAGQKQQAGQTRTSLVEEARRQGAEGLQGIQSKFGGSTGTGAFVGELLQRDVSRNIGEQNVAFQNSLAQIAQSESELKRNVQNILGTIEQNTNEAVQQLQQGFQQRLQELTLSKVGLESEKTSAKLDLVQRFREDRQRIDANNQAIKQSLLIKAAEAQGQFDKFKGEQARSLGDIIAQVTGQGGEVAGIDEGLTAGQFEGTDVPESLRFLFPQGGEQDDLGTDLGFQSQGGTEGI